ncbi:group II intron reverse transcriptase/maturase [Acetobacterium sp. KB-1]|uniref:group II intron reverse transcriptase/maturase n=1 Tax=Acetobacterium sp. KB-1 TaxID=2184575 RepID=UPI00352A9238
MLQAYKCVKANKGAGGIDGINFEKYEKDLKNNLYKLWNRMSSGSYFQKPVKGAEIPKRNGEMRLLGIPTNEDRIAQMVVRLTFEPIVEPIFYDNSFGYRPNRSSINAVAITRERCWKMPWLIEFDIVGLFDNIDHTKMMKAVKWHTDEKWVILYIERFLKAPIVMNDGELRERSLGTSQGGVISPVLANLFMHYAFDTWISRKYPQNPWVCYADDGVIHCQSEQEAFNLLEYLKKRMLECGLEIHPYKTKIVYGRSDRYNKRYENESFDFLGYTFRRRSVKSKNGNFFNAFSPAVSKSSAQNFRDKIRKIRKSCKTSSLESLAEKLNSII